MQRFGSQWQIFKLIFEENLGTYTNLSGVDSFAFQISKKGIPSEDLFMFLSDGSIVFEFHSPKLPDDSHTKIQNKIEYLNISGSTSAPAIGSSRGVVIRVAKGNKPELNSEFINYLFSLVE